MSRRKRKKGRFKGKNISSNRKLKQVLSNPDFFKIEPILFHFDLKTRKKMLDKCINNFNLNDN